MKSTGIVRNIDMLGRIVLPIEIFTDNDKIILRKYQPSCIFCGKADGVESYKDKLVCRKCMEDLALKFVNDKLD